MFCEEFTFSETILKIIHSVKVKYKPKEQINYKTLAERFKTNPGSLTYLEGQICSKAYSLGINPVDMYVEPQEKYEYFGIFLPILTNSFMRFTDTKNEWDTILRDIYHVSLLKKLSKKRIKGLFYPFDVDKLLNSLKIMKEKIKITKAHSDNVFDPYMINDDGTILIIKFSNIKLEWLIELKDKGVNQAFVLNPIQGLLYHIKVP
jgi:hypothetical protein